MLNLSIPQCYNLANSGIIPKSDNGVWDLTRCANAYIKYLQNRSGDEKRDYNTERTRLTKAQADKVEMEIHVMAGHLLPANVVETVWGGMTSSARKRLLTIPYRVALHATACTSFEEIEDNVTILINEALNELHEFNPSDYQPPGTVGKTEVRVDMETSAKTDNKSVGKHKPNAQRGG